jgi:hypothetical protein
MKLRLRKLGNKKRNNMYYFYLTVNKALSIAILRYELKGKTEYEIFNIR